MQRIILVTSCKGGVGKSTVSANLAMSLSARGKKVVLIDMDLGNRSLDLILGCEDRMVYDIADVCSGRVEPRSAMIDFESPRSFSFIGAPFMYEDNITKEALSDTLKKIKEETGADYIILDTSGGADISVELCASVADEGIIVSSQNPASVRAAAKSASLLDFYGVGEVMLVINSMDMDAKDLYGAIEIIDASAVRLIGIVPKDPKIESLAYDGKLSFERKRVISTAAFKNIAARIDGEKVRLLDKVKGISSRRRRQILSGR